MVSIIITSYKEADTIRRAIRSAVDREYSGLHEPYELLTVIPDEQTHAAAAAAVKEFGISAWKDIRDPLLGKPHALNLALSQAQGDELIFTDGDVYFSEGTTQALLTSLRADRSIGAVSGRQFSLDSRSSMWGYFSYLFVEAINRARSVLLRNQYAFYPLSGYVMAVKRAVLNFALPDEVLVDDAYISYRIYNDGYRIAYQPKAAAYVSYPKNFRDYLKQKIRSTGGYLQLKQYNIVRSTTKVRTFRDDLRQFLFPLRFARSFRELLWSELLYPIRLYLWLLIWVKKTFTPRQFNNSWRRVESTK